MKERVVYIDWIRIIAALMVVIIHTSGALYLNNPKGSIAYMFGIWNQVLVNSAVPLFFMISGALLLRPDYDACPRKMVIKAVKLLLLMLVWSFIYALVYVHPLTIKGIVFATIKGHFHFWFFEYLIGLYLLTPLFKVISDYKDGVLVRYYLVLYIFFGIIISSLQAMPFCHKWIMDVTTKINVEWLGFAGYFFMGHYLHQKRYAIPVWVLGLVFMGAVVLQCWFVGHIVLLYSSDKFWWLTFIQASSLYMLFMQINNANEQGGVKQRSSLAMGVYILHPFVLEHIPESWWTLPLYGADVLMVYGGALLASYAIMKIPYVGKWLMTV